jgi:uncharacterized protein YbaP (TraB family)
VKQSRADCAKGRADLLKNAAATQLRVVELEQELKQVREMAAIDKKKKKKKLEDELAKEKRKTKEANAQFNTANISKIDFLTDFHTLLSCAT